MTTIYDLISTLKQTRIETMEIVQQIDLEAIVYPKSGWRVHDIVTHLTWSDEQAVEMIHAFLEDRVYQLPPHLSINTLADVHRRNAWVRRQRFMENPQMVMSEFMQAHEALQSAIFSVGTSRLQQEFTAYWGDKITAQTLAVWQIQHDQHHQRDLAKILGYANVLDNRVYSLLYSEA